MRILCRHGHFALYPQNAEEVSRFVRYFSQPLIRVNDFYTFPLLSIDEKFSVAGVPFFGVPATVTYEGEAWEVMKENDLVYNVSTMTLSPKLSITYFLRLEQIGNYWIANVPLIQPGSIDPSIGRIMSYDAEFDLLTSSLKVFGVSNE